MDRQTCPVFPYQDSGPSTVHSIAAGARCRPEGLAFVLRLRLPDPLHEAFAGMATDTAHAAEGGELNEAFAVSDWEALVIAEGRS